MILYLLLKVTNQFSSMGECGKEEHRKLRDENVGVWEGRNGTKSIRSGLNSFLINTNVNYKEI